MASRLGRRALFNLPSLRATGRNAGRRWMATAGEHGGEHAKGSDLPWQIGSAVVFGSGLFYVLSLGAKEKKAHHATAHKSHASSSVPHTPEPTKDSEGTEVPAGEVKQSFDQAFSADSPKDAQEAEEKSAGKPQSEGSGITDDEGTTVSQSEANASSQQAFSEDSPADAQKAEEDQAKAEKSEPQQEQPGTPQQQDDSGKTDQGESTTSA